MANLEERVRNYEKLLQANETALERLGQLTHAQQIAAQEIDALFAPIHAMEACLVKIYTTSFPFDEGRNKESYFNHLAGRLTKVKEETKQRLRFAVFDKERTAISPAIREEILQCAPRWVAQLQQKLEGEFAAEDAKIDDLQTPHDFIRYMHRIGTELFYDPNGEQWAGITNLINVCKKEGGGFELYLASMTGSAYEYFQNNPFLERFHEIMKTEKFASKYWSNVRIRALAGERVLSFQLPLGCHYATLQLKEEKGQYHMAFKFTDTTTCRTSGFRSNVTEKLLQSLGYTVSRNKNVMWFNERFDSLDAATNNFEEIIRLSVSLHDVDVMRESDVIFRENDVVAAYHAGVINLAKYISQSPRGTYVEFAKACHSYRGPEIIKQLEKPIEQPESTRKAIRKKPLEYVVDSLKDSYAAVKGFYKDTDPCIDIEDKIFQVPAGAFIGAAIGLVFSFGYFAYKNEKDIESTESLDAALYAPLPVCPLENTKDRIIDSPIKVSQK